MAFEFVYRTNRNVFLTGRAGTGKTTFLNRLRTDCPKRMVVVAPTGVAAINAGGVTIHSMFQLPFAPFFPETAGLQNNPLNAIRYRKQKIRLLKSIDLLVIDEISMVRADILDAVDALLRKYRFRGLPFGGVQVLMIGDVHQLPPVVKDDEWKMLRLYYENMYFFSSHAFRNANAVVIELKQIFRQRDLEFIHLLEKIRSNGMDKATMNLLNSRWNRHFHPESHPGCIILTTHNAQAENINSSRLAGLPGSILEYEAEIKGEFPEYMYPTLRSLSLKEGAQVMFIKNDISPAKQYYNGKIGQIVHLSSEQIVVQCPGDDDTIDVVPAEWSNVKFSLNEATREIEEEEIGSFRQLPLKLAWAITIHKSQGLTFDEVVVDAAQAFAHGQVYVALSRCRTLDGLILSSQVGWSGIITDREVLDFNRRAEDAVPDEAELEQSKLAFRAELLRLLFSFDDVSILLNRFKFLIAEAGPSVSSSLLTDINDVIAFFESEIKVIALRFTRQLDGLLADATDQEGEQQLIVRVRKAALYFREKLKLVHDFTAYADVSCDNLALEDELLAHTEDVQRAVHILSVCFDFLQSKFDVPALLRMRSDADLDFRFSRRQRVIESKKVKVAHPKLYALLRDWRDQTADDAGMERYRVMPNKVLEDIADQLPRSREQLAMVKGLGKKKIGFFAGDIMKIIVSYCKSEDMDIPKLPGEDEIPALEAHKPKKIHSSELSLTMFREGKSPHQIAAERGLTEATVAGHLLKFIPSGDISIADLVSKEKGERILQAVHESGARTMTEIRQQTGNDVAFHEIRWMLAWLETQQ